ncbi:MAG: DUF1801 domain-containing protein [Bacteroidetes bacterium]|nr:DUF1801 domain-containing protein [Bacteroidota bacterium]
MDTKIEKFLSGMTGEKRELAVIVREIFLSTDKKITETIKWGNLTFVYKGNLAFVYTYKKVDYINVGFLRALELSDPGKLFQGTGKGMRHIKIFSEKDIPKTQLKKWIKEAIKLNDED